MKTQPSLTSLQGPLNYTVSQKKMAYWSLKPNVPHGRFGPNALFPLHSTLYPISDWKSWLYRKMFWMLMLEAKRGCGTGSNCGHKRYEKLAVGWLRGVNAFKLMPVVVLFLCVCLLKNRLSETHGERNSRGRRKNTNWPAKELSQHWNSFQGSSAHRLSRQWGYSYMIMSQGWLQHNVLLSVFSVSHLPSLRCDTSLPLLDNCAKIYIYIYILYQYIVLLNMQHYQCFAMKTPYLQWKNYSWYLPIYTTVRCICRLHITSHIVALVPTFQCLNQHLARENFSHIERHKIIVSQP